MEEQVQKVNMSAIERALTNFKKTGKAKLTSAMILQRINLLKATFAQCEQNHAKLLVTTTVEFRAKERYFTEKQFLTCEDAFYEALDYMTERYQQLTQPEADQSQGSAAANSSLKTPKANPQLPRISLPKFSGDFVDWETFHDHFRSVVLENEDLSDIARMHYLLSCLKGDASDLVRTLPITDANFKIAWNVLLQRHDNKRRLIHEHLHVLNTLPLVSSESAFDLTTLRDKTSMAIRTMKNLGRPVEHFSDFLVYLVSQRLDKAMRKAWELHLGNAIDYPSYEELEQFPDARIRALENILPGSNVKPKGARSVAPNHSTTAVTCPVCQQSHVISACAEFKGKTIQQRRELAKKLHRCFNCLGIKHSSKECPSKNSCRTCQKRHHTLLHEIAPFATSDITASTLAETSVIPPAALTSNLMSPSDPPQLSTLLATAWIRVSLPEGRYSIFRAMLDQGSAITLVTERLAQRLRLKRQQNVVAISGISGAAVSARHSVQIKVAARDGKGPSHSVSALVLRTLTTYVPPPSFHLNSLPHLRGLNLADNNPTSTDSIDILIGADLYGCILLSGLRRGSSQQPIAQNTIFGWILSGIISELPSPYTLVVTTHHCCGISKLGSEMRRFWEVEEIASSSPMTDEEQRCEEHFRVTHTRDSSGRYVLRLPFKQGPPIDIGESKGSALRLLQHAERRFKSQLHLADEYTAFMTDYERLGHMKPAPISGHSSTQTVYVRYILITPSFAILVRPRVYACTRCLQCLA